MKDIRKRITYVEDSEVIRQHQDKGLILVSPEGIKGAILVRHGRPGRTYLAALADVEVSVRSRSIVTEAWNEERLCVHDDYP